MAQRVSNIFDIYYRPSGSASIFHLTAFIVNRRWQSNANTTKRGPVIIACNGKIMFDRDFMDAKGPPLILLPMKRRISILTTNAVPRSGMEFLSAI